MRKLLLAAALAVAVSPAAAAERIVSLGGAVTEILFALGEGPKVVARDTTSAYPDAVWDLPDVGYIRSLSAEPILSFEPDLVVASDQSAPRTALDQVASAGVPVVLVPDEQNRPLTLSYDGVTETRVYDERDRLSSVSWNDGQQIGYQYDKAGNRTKVTTPTRVLDFGYDELNRLKTVSEPPSAVYWERPA